MSFYTNFILEEVIAELVDDTKSLVAPLMKLQYFAKRISNQELYQFVLFELNGYKGSKELPDYRTSAAMIEIDIQFGTETYRHLEFPAELLQGKGKEKLKKFYVYDSVSVLEQMASRTVSKDDKPFLVLPIPLTMMELFQDGGSKLYRNPYFKGEVVGARILTNRNVIFTALTAIRSRLLSFCMEVGETFGYNIEIESFNKYRASNNEKVVHLMSTVINNHGDGSIINTGDKAKIQATISISKGNKEQLNDRFKQLRIDPIDIEEINEIVEEEGVNSVEKKLGDKTIDWISKVSGKALKGVGGIAKEATSSLLANILMQYLGIPQ